MPGIEDRIADLERRLKQAKALKQQQVARERAADKKRQRSEETRRKILVGAVILAKVEHGEWPKERLREWMDKAVDPRRRPGAVRPVARPVGSGNPDGAICRNGWGASGELSLNSGMVAATPVARPRGRGR